MMEPAHVLRASRIAAVIAFALFIQGAAWNANVVRVEQAPYCPYLKDGVFAGAAVLALAATALSITSFIMQRTQPAAAATVTGASAVGTPNMPGAGAGGQQSPSPEVVMGQPLFPSGKAQNDYPVKPQGYEQQPHQQVQQVPPPTESHHPPQGYAQSAAQGNVSHAPNHQLPPRPAAPAAAAAPAAVAAAAAASAPSVLQPALGTVAMGQPLPLQVPPQYCLPVPAPQIGGVDIPAALPSAAAPPAAGSGSTLSTAIRNEVVRQGIRMAAEVVKDSLFPENGGSVLSMMTDSAGDRGDAVQVTN